MDINKLWERYTKHRDIETRNKIIRHYYYLVDIFYIKFYKKTPESYREDLKSCIHIGLINAVEKFDPTMWTKFTTYAKYRISGEVKEQLRKLSYYSRRVIIDKKKIRDGIEEFISIECSTDINYNKLKKYLKINDRRFKNLIFKNNIIVQNSKNLNSYASDYNLEEEVINKILIDEILKEILKMDYKVMKVLILKYFENKRNKDIAEILNLSESRISQINKIGISKLKKIFEIK